MAQVCDPDELGCDVCFELTLQLSSSMFVDASIAGGIQVLYLWITTKFGTQYMVPVTTGADGSFYIVQSDFPDGMFNEDSGIFYVFLSTDVGGTLIVPSIFDAVEYNCLLIDFDC